MENIEEDKQPAIQTPLTIAHYGLIVSKHCNIIVTWGDKKKSIIKLADNNVFFFLIFLTACQ